MTDEPASQDPELLRRLLRAKDRIGEAYKSAVKTTFAKGAFLPDPSGLFNSSLDGKVRRAIDFRAGDKLDKKALKALIRAAVALNQSSARG